jgi:hypothetical protein
MNDSARKQNLIFRQTIDESYFKNVDIPLYIPEGIELMEVNLFAFKDKKIREGKGTSAKRISLLGATTVKLIYLNAVNSVTPIKELRRAILKFIVSINKKYCEPPVPHREVLNSFNANWKKFKAGELDFSMYLTKRRAFWSKLTTLSSNEKRKITCAIKNEPIVAESKRKILEAIVQLHSQGEKITQKKVGSIPGLTLPLVKKYRKYFNECRDVIVASSVNNETNEIPEETSIKHEMEVAQNNIEDDCLNVLNVPTGCKNASEATQEDFLDFDDDEDTLFIENCTPRKLEDSYVDYTDEQLQVIFDRIYNSVKSKITPEQNKELCNNFCKEFKDLSVEDKKILSLGIDDITDSGMFFKQVNLDLKFLNLCAEMLQSD